jgi:hypothetical protein
LENFEEVDCEAKTVNQKIRVAGFEPTTFPHCCGARYQATLASVTKKANKYLLALSDFNFK